MLLRKPLKPYAIDRIVDAAQAIYVDAEANPKEFSRDRIIAILYRHLEIEPHHKFAPGRGGPRRKRREIALEID